MPTDVDAGSGSVFFFLGRLTAGRGEAVLGGGVAARWVCTGVGSWPDGVGKGGAGGGTWPAID